MRKVLISYIIYTCYGILLCNSPAQAEERWEYFTSPETITELTKHENYIWYGSDAGIYRWDLTDMTYTRLTANDGLSNNDVSGLGVAPDGTVWISTVNGEVSSHSSGSWQREDTFAGFNHILTLTVDENGVPWCGPYIEAYMNTSGGAYRYDGTQWFSSKDASYPYVLYISFAPDETPWIICSTKPYYDLHVNWYTTAGVFAVMHLSGDTWINAGLPVEHGRPVEITCGSDGTVWTATFSGRVLSFKETVWHAHPVPAGIDSLSIIDLAAAPDSTVWALTDTGNLVAFGDDGAIIVHSGGGLPDARELLIDENGTVWAGTRKGDLAQFENDSWTLFPIKKVNMPHDVWLITTDRYGDIWAITEMSYPIGNSRVFHYMNGAWENIFSSLNMEFDGTMLFDSQNTLWLYTGSCAGDSTNTLFYRDGDSLLPAPGLPQVSGVAVGPGDVFWCGGWNTLEDPPLMTYSAGTAESIQPPESFDIRKDSTLIPLGIESNGAAWVCTGVDYWMKLFQYENGTWTSYPDLFSSPTEWTRIGGFVLDRNTAWLSVNENHGTTHHRIVTSFLYRKDDGGFTQVLSYPNEMYLRTVDTRGHIWLSLSHWDDLNTKMRADGVLEQDGDIQRIHTEFDGLPSNDVRDAVSAADGSIWFATSKGVCRLIPENATIVEEEIPELEAEVRSFPNPFNSSTTIQYTVSSGGSYEMRIYSVIGQQVRTYRINAPVPESYSLVWDGIDEWGTDVSSGIYFAQLRGNGATGVARMMLIR